MAQHVHVPFHSAVPVGIRGQHQQNLSGKLYLPATYTPPSMFAQTVARRSMRYGEVLLNLGVS